MKKDLRSPSLKLPRALDRLLGVALVYKTWQGLLADKKIAPLLAYVKFESIESALDLGCGPGTNAKYFSGIRYVGVDLNSRYIAYAQKHFSGSFIAADATDFSAERETFDLILINSLMHHLDDDACRRLLKNAKKSLSSRGAVHILDAIRNEKPSLSRVLADLDRGHYMRAPDRWESIIGAFFQEQHYQRYTLELFGLTAYEMFYFVGTR